MTASFACPESLCEVWAKSPAEDETVGETLSEHTWQVLSRVRDLARLRPGLPSLVATPRLWHLLFWAAFLHDWGKLATGFQQAVRGGPRWSHRHEVLSLLFVDWLAQELHEQEASWLATVIATHHRDLSELQRLYPPGLTAEDDPTEALIKELPADGVEGLARWLWEVGPSWIQALELETVVSPIHLPPSTEDKLPLVFVNGARRIHHWLQSSRRLLEDMAWPGTMGLRLCTLLLRGYLIQCDHTASAHAEPMQPCPTHRHAVLTGTGVPLSQLYPHQVQAGESLGETLLIAPTGSGKTEAALLWAAGQAAARGPLPRLFYTLPYQASMNAMYDRLEAIFPDRVGLLHGRSTLALYRRLMERDHTPSEATRAARWLRNLARLNVPPVRVFSPYQMLKAAYQLKGYEALLADYAQAAFVFDEIHAYEPERLAMILETVRYLRCNLGATFFVMTATLPPPVQERVRDVLGDPSVVRAAHDLYLSFTRHRLHLLTGQLLHDVGLQAIVRAFRAGQSVLVTCNTVARAQQAYHSLTVNLPDIPSERIILVHGGYNGRDRLQKERCILGEAGLGASRRRPVLVVSTQVVEVSLNIDLDSLFSDPAPLEALVQRFGRVNRKGRLALAPVHIFQEPRDGQGIYDQDMVAATLELLAERVDGRPVNEAAIQEWLDDIYQGSVLNEWEQRYDNAACEFRRAFLDCLRPFSTGSGLEDAFNRLFDGLEILPLCCEEEYDRLLAERPLEAAELLVPISWGRWWHLRRLGRLVTPSSVWPPVVDVPYSPELGLSKSQDEQRATPVATS